MRIGYLVGLSLFLGVGPYITKKVLEKEDDNIWYTDSVKELKEFAGCMMCGVGLGCFVYYVIT